MLHWQARNMFLVYAAFHLFFPQRGYISKQKREMLTIMIYVEWGPILAFIYIKLTFFSFKLRKRNQSALYIRNGNKQACAGHSLPLFLSVPCGTSHLSHFEMFAKFVEQYMTKVSAVSGSDDV